MDELKGAQPTPEKRPRIIPLLNHKILQCPFARDVSTRASAWAEGMVQVPEQHLNMEGWRNLPVVSNDRKVRKVKAVLLMYVAWNLKRGTSASSNHQLRSMQPSQILQEIKSALRTRTVACGSPALPPFLSMFSSVFVEFECLFVFLFVISVCNLESNTLASLK